MASKRFLGIFRAGVVATLRTWKSPPGSFVRFSIVKRWHDVGYDAFKNLAKKVWEEEGGESRFKVEGTDSGYGFRFSSKQGVFEIELDENEVKLKVGDEEEKVSVYVIDEEMKKLFGPQPPRVKTQREIWEEEKNVLEGTPNKKGAQIRRYKDLEQMIAKWDRDHAGEASGSNN